MAGAEIAGELGGAGRPLVSGPCEVYWQRVAQRERWPWQRNVLGEALETCSIRPMSGFYRTGCCETGPEDVGAHVVCAEVTEEFLAFSRTRGNDLSTPVPEIGFPGLRPGDRWCLCAARWKEALDAGVAPRVVLRATHENALEYVSFEELKKRALDLA